MSRILYSKYSNERAACFQIRTDILEVDGKRYARKRAYNKAAKAHVAQIAIWAEELNKTYKGTQLVANRAEVKEDGVYFEYLEGETFEQRLDRYLLEEEYTKLLAEINDFFDMVKGTSPLKTFQMTEDFQRVFGEISFPKTLQAAELNNIDYIFGNIFLGEKEWTVIDYEWTFSFPIPFLYLVYRAVHYYTYDRSREKLREIGLLRMLGITEELELCFRLMEHRFQLYILGDTTPVVNMYNDIAGAAFSFKELVEEKRVGQYANQACVYYDFGGGFSENCKELLRCNNSGSGSFEYVIETKGAKAFRIDPAEHTCVLSELRILSKGTMISIPYFETNGYKVGESVLFATNDPQIVISSLPDNTTTLTVCFRMELLSESVAAEFAGKVCEYAEFEAFLGGPEEAKKVWEDLSSTRSYKSLYESAVVQKAVVESQLHEVQKKYEDTLSSLSIKITKPLRASVRVGKKIIKSNKVTHKMARGLKCLKQNGLSYTCSHTIEKIERKLKKKRSGEWIINQKELEKQRTVTFSKDVLFSVIVPLYNTPEKYLREMIESVQAQTYPKWELCLADGSDVEHAYVEKICDEYAKKDTRIRYNKLKKNEGISENTNHCLRMATGNYIALFDHDDLLHPSALYENMCVIEEQDADFIYSDENTFSNTPADAYCPHYKPDFSPDTLRSYNYICHFSVFKRSLLNQVGLFRKEFDGSQDYDMILRLTEKAKVIAHIPKIIYYWRAHPASVASNISAKTYCLDAAKKALAEHMERVGLSGNVEDASIPSVYKMNYDIKGNPMISILIPNKDYIEDLSKCINSILEKSTYNNYEIIVIENNSELESTFAYYKAIEQNEKVRVVYWESEFNYSAINNFGAKYAQGEYVLLLNNDMEIISPDWLQEMLMFAQREDVGAVGAKLYYPDDTVQHAGIIIGIGGVAGHSHKNFARDAYGYSSRLQLAQNLSAVTAACMLIRRDVFDTVGGLDEGFKVAFNDVDLCMKIREAGYLIVFTPFAELYHYESKSRGYENTPEKVARFNSEIQRFYSKWDPALEAGDPYYNPNLTLRTEDFAIKPANEGRIRA